MKDIGEEYCWTGGGGKVGYCLGLFGGLRGFGAIGAFLRICSEQWLFHCGASCQKIFNLRSHSLASRTGITASYAKPCLDRLIIYAPICLL